MATREEGIKSLKKVAEVLGHSPSRREYEKNPHCTVDEHALRRLFGSFKNVLRPNLAMRQPVQNTTNIQRAS